MYVLSLVFICYYHFRYCLPLWFLYRNVPCFLVHLILLLYLYFPHSLLCSFSIYLHLLFHCSFFLACTLSLFSCCLSSLCHFYFSYCPPFSLLWPHNTHLILHTYSAQFLCFRILFCSPVCCIYVAFFLTLKLPVFSVSSLFIWFVFLLFHDIIPLLVYLCILLQ